MSFFNDVDMTSFLSNINTPQKINNKNISIIKNNDIQPTNLFKNINTNKKANNIFTTTDNQIPNIGIFSFPKNKSNNLNNCNNNISYKNNFEISNNNQNQSFFTHNNNNEYYDSTIGTIFKGILIKGNKENIKLMSITSLPEFSHGSFEELRMADFERKKTGNIKFFKIKNTNITKNIFNNNNNNLNSYNNNIFNKNIFNENPKNNNENIQENLFNTNTKIESNLFNFSSTKEKDTNLFQSNKIRHNKNNSISFAKLNNLNSPFSYFTNNNDDNNYFENNYKNNNVNSYSFINNIPNETLFQQNSNNINNNNYNSNFNNNNSNKEIENPLTDLDIYKLLCIKRKYSKEINEAIEKGKTVKEFLEDLDKRYNNSNNSNEIKFNESQNISNNSEISDLYQSYISNNSNGITSNKKNNDENDNLTNISPIKLRNSFNEIQCYKMEIENDINYDKLTSKINNIYNLYEKNKISNNNSLQLENDKNKNIPINQNENYINKSFSNGFPNYNSLLDNSITKSNKSFTNNKNILIGRDENLYQQNLFSLNKLSLSNININTNEKNGKNERNEIFAINNNENNDIKNNNILKKTIIENNSRNLTNIENENINLIIKYHLPDEIDNNNDNKNLNFYETYLYNISIFMKIKELKEEIKFNIYNILKNKNINNYAIVKISLLTPIEFLSDNKIIKDYKLDTYNYSIQAFISYKKVPTKNKNNELAPIELVPKLNKPGYKCFPSICELCRKTCEELKKIQNFKIFNEFGEVLFMEPVNLLGLNLDNEITITEDLIETGDKLNYWSIFKLYNFIVEKNEIDKYILNIKNCGGKFISYINNELIWEYKGNNGIVENM